MKITAINSLQHVMGKVHMDIAIQSSNTNRDGTTAPHMAPLSTKVNLGATDVARMLKQEDFDTYTLLNSASSTPIAAQNKNVNILSEPDAVAQEMMQNLRPSMSQSGDGLLTGGLMDITMPDNKMSVSARHLDQVQNIQERFPDLSDTQFADDFSTQNFLDNLQAQPPIPIAKRPAEQAQMDVATTQPNPSQLFASNYRNNLPPSEVPADVHYSNVPQKILELQSKEPEALITQDIPQIPKPPLSSMNADKTDLKENLLAKESPKDSPSILEIQAQRQQIDSQIQDENTPMARLRQSNMQELLQIVTNPFI